MSMLSFLQYESKYEGDLVAKFCFAQKKIVWEVLVGELKSKIEIQWSDIIELKANCPNDGPSSLSLVVIYSSIFCLSFSYFRGSWTCKTHVQLCMGNCPVYNDLSMIFCVLQVARQPLFFRETNLQPRKHTSTTDFTGGQANIHMYILFTVVYCILFTVVY
jgi:hypothetical protein